MLSLSVGIYAYTAASRRLAHSSCCRKKPGLLLLLLPQVPYSAAAAVCILLHALLRAPVVPASVQLPCVQRLLLQCRCSPV
jgi:hypothetical protein